MRTFHAIGLIVTLWALLYLSFLGERELRGEEARRIVPAQEMIQNDQWIVPTLAGEPYGNKPPLINWIIAGSFLLTGSESEWAARLPSVVSLLALCLAAFFVLRNHFGTRRAMFVTFVFLTAASMIEKCRMAEIEAVFIALFGLACLFWISLWTSNRSPWLIWTIPYVFLGLGNLAKGPVHLLFWILFLLPILRSARSTRDFFHPAHFLGLILLFAIPLPWVFANLSAAAQPDDSVGNWVNEITKRADISTDALKEWAMHPFELLLNFLPWTIPLLFSLWCLRKTEKPTFPLSKWDAVTRGCAWCGLFSALALLAIPGGLPRYFLPLYTPVAIAVIALYFRVGESQRNAYERFSFFSLLVFVGIGFLAAIGGSLYTIQEGLSPLWAPISFGLLLLAGYLVWLLRKKTAPGVFYSAPILVAIVFFLLSSVAIPLERQEYQWRKGAADLRELGYKAKGVKVFFADDALRNVFSRHLRLLYYISEDFTCQGESKALPQNTRFLVARSGASSEIQPLFEGFEVIGKSDIEIDGLPFTAYTLTEVKK